MVLALVRVHLAAPGKQRTAVQTLKAMVRVPQVRLYGVPGRKWGATRLTT